MISNEDQQNKYKLLVGLKDKNFFYEDEFKIQKIELFIRQKLNDIHDKKKEAKVK